jgi:hypothetical protein
VHIYEQGTQDLSDRLLRGFRDMNLHPLNCVGIDKVSREFWWEKLCPNQTDSSVITFKVHKSNPPGDDDSFDMNLARCPSGIYKITEVNHYDHPHYSKMGIGDALIPEASRVLNAAIRSSSNRNPERPNEFRHPDAEKIWKRLMASGLARYCSVKDFYVHDEYNRVDVCTDGHRN